MPPNASPNGWLRWRIRKIPHINAKGPPAEADGPSFPREESRRNLPVSTTAATHVASAAEATGMAATAEPTAVAANTESTSMTTTAESAAWSRVAAARPAAIEGAYATAVNRPAAIYAATAVPAATAIPSVPAIPAATIPTMTPSPAIPRPGSDEDPAIEPIRPVVAVRDAGIGVVRIIAPRADRGSVGLRRRGSRRIGYGIRIIRILLILSRCRYRQRNSQQGCQQNQAKFLHKTSSCCPVPRLPKRGTGEQLRSRHCRLLFPSGF